MFFFGGARNVFVKVEHVFAQPSRDFSLWRSANLDIARATLSALCGDPGDVLSKRS